MKLRKLTSNQESFREVNFRNGLNVILADRHYESTKTDSRNGLGKTTLVEIIHFCLGGRLGADQRLQSLSGSDWSFSLHLEFDTDIEVIATRSMDERSKIIIEGDLPENVSHVVREQDRGSYSISISVAQWTRILGILCFGFDEKLFGERYAPTFRALVSYVARRGKSAFVSPFESRKGQLVWQKQVYNAYLTNLDWRIATEWQELRDQKKASEAIAGLADRRDASLGSLAELEAERARLNFDLRRLQDQLESFTVVAEYETVEQQANDLTKEMRELANQNTFDRRLLGMYEERLVSEETPDVENVMSMYEEAQVVLGESVRRTLTEVVNFHEEVTRNRAEYLSEEVRRLEHEIASREARVARLDSARSDLLSILSNGGALDDFVVLQRKVAETTAALERMNSRIEQARALRATRVELDESQERLQRRALVDMGERRKLWTEVISWFGYNTQVLYGEPGRLLIDANKSGFQFNYEIRRGGSDGVDNMAILCYDLAIAQVWNRKPVAPAFLIHDSIIFDGVDERQVNASLEQASSECQTKDFQYIAMLNSDSVPVDLWERDMFVDSVVLRLTDADESGSLLGMRF